MNDNILNNDQWVQLWEAINLFDQKGDRTVLNRVLVSIMKDYIESLDIDSQVNDDNNMDKMTVITVIESELAEMTSVNACPIWCCRRRQIQPFHQNNHKFSDYLINMARAKSIDKNNSGFIPKETVQQIFKEQLSTEKMAELLHFVLTGPDGNINYKDFATLMLITR